jgi:CDP-diacylglycerol pyrophosphatase
MDEYRLQAPMHSIDRNSVHTLRVDTCYSRKQHTIYIHIEVPRATGAARTASEHVNYIHGWMTIACKLPVHTIDRYSLHMPRG